MHRSVLGNYWNRYYKNIQEPFFQLSIIFFQPRELEDLYFLYLQEVEDRPQTPENENMAESKVYMAKQKHFISNSNTYT